MSRGSLTGLDTGYIRDSAKSLRGALRGFEPLAGGPYLSLACCMSDVACPSTPQRAAREYSGGGR